jgi:WD40 repeat protein
MNLQTIAAVTLLTSLVLGSPTLAADRPVSPATRPARLLGRLDPLGTSKLEFSPDGSLLLTSGMCGHYEVFNEKEGRAEPLITTETQIWDVATLKQLTVPAELTSRLGASSTFTAGGKAVFTYGGDEARLWDPRTGKVLLRIPEPRGVWHAAVSPDASLIAIDVYERDRDQNEGAIDLYDARSGQRLRTCTHPSIVDYIAGELTFSPDGSRLLLAAYDSSQYSTEGSRFRMYDVRSGRELFEAIQTQPGCDRHPNTGAGWACSRAGWSGSPFSPDGTRFIAEQTIYDVRSGAPLTELQPGVWGSGSAQFTPDGRHIIGKGDDVRLWDATGKPMTEPLKMTAISPPWGTLPQVVTNRDGTRLYTGDGALDTATGRLVVELDRTKTPVWTDNWAISPDGRRLAVAGRDNLYSYVLVWDVGE